MSANETGARQSFYDANANFKVLVVEDDKTYADLLRQELERRNFFVRVTHDGGVAASMLQTESFHAILLDLRLPGMNGLHVAASARNSKINRDAQLFVVSGSIDQSSLERAKLLRIVKVFVKPVPPDMIAATLTESLQRKTAVLRYDVKLINAFIESASEVFKFYFQQEPKRGKPVVTDPQKPARGHVTGLIGFTGTDFVGSLAVSLNGHFLDEITKQLFQGAAIELNEELITDITGELCNQILGKVKINFARLGVAVTIGLPEVIVGKGHRVVHKVNNPVIAIPIGVEKLAFEIMFCLSKQELKAEQARTQDVPAESVLFFD